MHPRSIVGRWLLATASHEPVEVRRAWGARLNGGAPGFNDDEPMVVLAACQSAMRTYFGRPMRESATPEDLATVASSASPSLNVSADKLRRFARAALDGSKRPDDLTPGEVLVAAGALFAFTSLKLGWDRDTLGQAIADAERRVEALGYGPPQADDR